MLSSSSYLFSAIFDFSGFRSVLINSDELKLSIADVDESMLNFISKQSEPSACCISVHELILIIVLGFEI